MSRRPLPPEHVAYMQVAAAADIRAHTVVYPTGELTADGIPVVTATFSPSVKCIVGVADAAIKGGTRGTVVVAGIVTLYASVFKRSDGRPGHPERDALAFGQVVFAADVAGDSDVVGGDGGAVPIGTLLATDVPGRINDVDGSYLPGGRLFLCPWMSAFTAPRHPPTAAAADSTAAGSSRSVSDDHAEAPWETFYDAGGVPREKRLRTVVTEETRDLAADDKTSAVDLKRMMGSAALDAMVGQMHVYADNDDPPTAETIAKCTEMLERIATAGIEKAKADKEAMRTCFVQESKLKSFYFIFFFIFGAALKIWLDQALRARFLLGSAER